MNHWIILPILIPAVVAPLLAMSVRHDIVLARIFSMMSTVALLLLGVGSVAISSSGDIFIYSLGNWPAPIGIVLVLDKLAAMMLVVTALLGVCVLLYSMGGSDREGEHFHPLFQFQLMGLNGAFLTGDLFNLFVFFEVLLIASYGLMNHGGGPARLRAGLQYMTINLVGSSIFLVALGLIYGITGTLNMADVAVKMRTIGQGDLALLVTGISLLIAVFGIKSAVFPLQFWLPGTYAHTCGVVAALFAIMTKVGVYAIIRVHSVLIDGNASSSVLAEPLQSVTEWLMPAAAITLLLGTIGILGAKNLSQQAAFMSLASIGTLLIAVAGFSNASIASALYYLIHSTFAVAALFLIVDMIIPRRKGEGGALTLAGRFSSMGILGSLFFVTAIAVIGMPPLSGFIGKILILDALRSSTAWVAIWALILVTSLLTMIGFTRSGSLLFWKSQQIETRLEIEDNTSTVIPLTAIFATLLLLVILTLGSALIIPYLDGIAMQLSSPQNYINVVLGRSLEVLP